MSLHPEAVSPRLFRLLHELMQEPLLKDFHLVGGTNLALRYGHRESVDIDLFANEAFDAGALHARLADRFAISESAVSANTVRGVIRGIKIDSIAHRFALVAAPEELDGIRMLSAADIAAMKLNAIANRGGKKDFWDYHELLKRHTCEEMLGFYAIKYPNGSTWNVEKSLSYFDDADNEPDPKDLRGIEWAQIKAELSSGNRL